MVYITHLRKVGDSIMLTIPPEGLDQLQLVAGSPVGVTVDGERLIIESIPAPRYALEDLQASTDHAAVMVYKTDIWMTSAPMGRELL